MTWLPCPNLSRTISGCSTAPWREFIASTEAIAALIIDKGGFLITQQGDAHDYDMTSIGALASGAFMANQTIANLVNETNFNSIYQQGENASMFVVNVDEHSLLVVIFKSHSGVGVVKYYAATAIKRIARQLKIARSARRRRDLIFLFSTWPKPRRSSGKRRRVNAIMPAMRPT